MFWKRYQEILGAVLIGIAVFFLVSIAAYHPSDYSFLAEHGTVKNITGPVGAWIGHIIRSLFGVASYGIIAVLIIPGIYLIKSSLISKVTEKTGLTLLVTISLSSVVSLSMGNVPQMSGGYLGTMIDSLFISLIGRSASYICLSAVVLISALLLISLIISPKHEQYRTETRLSGIMRRLQARFRRDSERDEIPKISFGKLNSVKKDRKFPWITKKRIIVYETEKAGALFDVMQFRSLPDAPWNSVQAFVSDNNRKGDIPLLDTPDNDEIYGKDEAEVILHEDEYRVDDELAHDRADENVDEEPIMASEETEINDGSSVSELSSEQIEGADCEEDNAGPEVPRQRATLQAMDSEIREDIAERVFDNISINEEYIIPTSYLTSSKPLDTESWKKEIHRNSVLLKNTLAEFGIEADVVNVNRGPVITLYEMQIAPGIKVNRVVGLADDIAMALAAQRVRIVAPIPGKSAIGVEIPNLYRETVTLGDIIKSDEFNNYDGSLVVALGKDILGKPVMLDLKRLPHLLIAGTTGSGKSVCVNSIITSLIYNYDPNYIRFILVDPKMVELQLYNGLPHLLTPVIVDPQVAPMVLKWTMHEMERRYCLLSALNTRDIERYNEKVARLKDGTEQLPFIVAIIDEMADLMMSSKEVEGYITRIAQKSRAVGIHLVVATQRPSVDIITGLIKANFPARIAFQVAQRTDSRTIIDQNGAEKLLGRGDMLYQSPTSSFPMRIQGGYISEEEIEKIATHLCKRGKPSYIDIEESLLEEEESKELDEASDELFQEALKIIEETKKASASYLQRRLSIGYNRAARIIEQMEDMGYIGPQIGSKPREVFI
ncbi:MAG: DNA translocase FtsK 4TM domain-containing protein [Spirochaetes bacterium]|nr:DNA translocase FtsK 4TM domain-containing protein [Spirochaetota bacterium]